MLNMTTDTPVICFLETELAAMFISMLGKNIVRVYHLANRGTAAEKHL